MSTAVTLIIDARTHTHTHTHTHRFIFVEVTVQYMTSYLKVKREMYSSKTLH